MKITVRGIKDEFLKEEVKAIIHEYCDCERVYARGFWTGEDQTGHLNFVEVYPVGSKSLIGQILYDVASRTPKYYTVVKRSQVAKTYALSMKASKKDLEVLERLHSRSPKEVKHMTAMKVKDVEVFFNNMYDFEHHVIGDFYDENNTYIGQIDRNCDDGFIWISYKLQPFWKNNVKILRACTGQNTTIFTFVVLKGE